MDVIEENVKFLEDIVRMPPPRSRSPDLWTADVGKRTCSKDEMIMEVDEINQLDPTVHMSKRKRNGKYKYILKEEKRKKKIEKKQEEKKPLQNDKQIINSHKQTKITDMTDGITNEKVIELEKNKKAKELERKKLKKEERKIVKVARKNEDKTIRSAMANWPKKDDPNLKLQETK